MVIEVIEVHKCGGKSVKDSEAMMNMANIFKKQIHRPAIIVVSAMAEMTNLLEKMHYEIVSGREAEAIILRKEFIDHHNNVVNELFPKKNNRIYTSKLPKLENEFYQTFEKYQYLKEALVRDELVSFGERFCSLIFGQYLKTQDVQNRLVPAIEFMITDKNFGEANVDEKNIQHYINRRVKSLTSKGHLVLTEGFIGSTTIGKNTYPTTFPREGSDISTKIVADGLDAKKIIFWKDTWLMDKNPSDPSAKKICFIKYDDYISNLSKNGILHEKALNGKKIPIEIKNFNFPFEEGSMIIP